MPTVLFLGATGFVGGPALVTLRKEFPTYTYKALARNPTAVAAFNGASFKELPPVEAVQGTFQDVELLEQLAYEADIVVNTADSDDLGLTGALLRGIKRRFDAGRGVGALVHTSGMGIYTDKAGGKFDPSARVWSDSEEDVRELAKTMPERLHGPVDIAIIKAQEAGYVNAYIVVPSAVHGAGSSPVPGRVSLFVKFVAEEFIKQKRAVYLTGKPYHLGTVHVDDLADLYVIVAKLLVAAPGAKLAESPYRRYVIASPVLGLPCKEIVNTLAGALHAVGALDSPVAVGIRPDEASPIVSLVLSANTTFKPVRAVELGWKPYRPPFSETALNDVSVFRKAKWSVNALT